MLHLIISFHNLKDMPYIFSLRYSRAKKDSKTGREISFNYVSLPRISEGPFHIYLCIRDMS